VCRGVVTTITADATGHDWSNKDGVCKNDATHTCAHEGQEAGTDCTVCGYAIPACNHDWNHADYTCRECGAVCSHDELKVIWSREPSCDLTGAKMEQCQVCRGVVTTITADATGHDWSNKDGVCKNDATHTCAHEGQEAGTDCTVCGYAIPACNHDWNHADYTCRECGAVCSHDELKVIWSREPSCDLTGAKMEQCQVCRGVVTTITADATGHDWSNKDGVCKNDATHICAHEGQEAGTECTVCGFAIPACNHNWNHETYTCLECGAVCSHDELKVIWSREPSCDLTGAKMEQCQVCRGVVTTITDDATGHDWSNNDGVCKNDATHTCAHEGQEAGTECTVCGFAIPACNHDWNHADYTCRECGAVCSHDELKVIWSREPSCDQTGAKMEQCQVCRGVVTTITADATGHDWSNKDGVCKNDATHICAHEDQEDGECTVCGEILDAQEEIPAHGEDHKCVVIKYEYNDDFTKETATYYCTKCGYTYTETNDF